MHRGTWQGSWRSQAAGSPNGATGSGNNREKSGIEYKCGGRAMGNDHMGKGIDSKVAALDLQFSVLLG